MKQPYSSLWCCWTMKKIIWLINSHNAHYNVEEAWILTSTIQQVHQLAKANSQSCSCNIARFPTKVQEPNYWFQVPGSILTRNFCSPWPLAYIVFSPYNRNCDLYAEEARETQKACRINFMQDEQVVLLVIGGIDCNKKGTETFILFVFCLYNLRHVYNALLNLASRSIFCFSQNK